MLSGPEAFDECICLRSFVRPFWSIVIFLILCIDLILVSGRSPLDDVVKTDLNWSNKISALPLLSFTRVVPFLSGAIPFASCLLHFTYFRNGLVLLLFKPSIMFVIVLPFCFP